MTLMRVVFDNLDRHNLQERKQTKTFTSFVDNYSGLFGIHEMN